MSKNFCLRCGKLLSELADWTTADNTLVAVRRCVSCRTCYCYDGRGGKLLTVSWDSEPKAGKGIVVMIPKGTLLTLNGERL